MLNCAHNNCKNDQVTLCLKAVDRTQPHARYRGKADAVAVLRQPMPPKAASDRELILG